MVIKGTSHLPVATYNHLLSSEHDICGSLQATRACDRKSACVRNELESVRRQ